MKHRHGRQRAGGFPALQRILRVAAVIGMVAMAGSLIACRSNPIAPAAGTADPVLPERPVVDALDRHTADARKARVSAVEYDLFVDLHGSKDHFGGKVTVTFELSDPASDLTLDFGGGTVQRLEVNGRSVGIDYNGHFLTLPPTALQRGANTATIEFEHPYDIDGTGLHRFVDPVDGLTYLYTYLWPYYANRLFPVFDQPNLKATISLSVLAPQDWTVVSTGTASTEAAGNGATLWRFSTTPPMSTYVFSLHAGPYRIWQDDADGVPIRLMARQSLAPFVAVDEWFDVTRRGLAFYGRYFEIPYPFGKYDQLIVPDFNIGAMENIAAVTFSEGYVQRQPSDRAERENRASTILHEMAHMWFGDLVTHEWWNGLWLNESFATQMAAISAAEVTEFKDTWHGFFTDGKQDAYRRDSRVTTHPIEVPVDSTADFFKVFDDITYEKGSSVLKQLAHYVGEENYRRGVSRYLKDHAYGTTELEDFVGHQQQSAGFGLERWSAAWLHTAGFNTLSVATECDGDRLRSLTVMQSAPQQYPVLRPHQVDVALYSLDGAGNVLPAVVIPMQIDGPRTTVPVPGERPCPALVNPNHNDWTYARIALDERGVAVLLARHASIPDPLSRSMFLAALFDRALAGEMPLADYVRHAMRLAQDEESIRVQQQISTSVVRAVAVMQRLRPQTDTALAKLLPELEQQSLDSAARATTGDLRRNWFSIFTGVASTPTGLEAARALLNGSKVIRGLDVSGDIRWDLLDILSRNGAVDIDALLATARAADPSDYGAKRALRVQAAQPDAALKANWLKELQSPRELEGLAKQRAVMSGLFPPNQTALQLELLPRILAALPDLSASSDPYFMSSYASVLLAPMCVEQSSALMQQTLDEYTGRLSSTALRFLREALQADQECLSLRGGQ